MSDIEKSIEYIERVIVEDYATDLDTLTALMLVAAGPIPPMKPYGVVGMWKKNAMIALLQFARDKPGYDQAKEYLSFAMRYLCRRKGNLLNGSPLQGWQVSYAAQIRAARRTHERR